VSKISVIRSNFQQSDLSADVWYAHM